MCCINYYSIEYGCTVSGAYKKQTKLVSAWSLGSIIMRLTLIFWLLLLWCGFHLAALCIAIILFLLLLSAIDELNGWD
ncbi:E5 protein [Bos taurus papillomavirus 6]|uniref:Uncharacterized protein E8 n=3 Tax=Bos taurus papillomavirus 6 TaxID=10563 RepID=VE8_BPV6|nr:RecName: Full=Uncharacterized protein E8 [Bos taurus papillomavirus 6]QYI89623.1 E8 early protein [Bos taurus papillomavirus 6]BAO50677.1 E5 protein [Bos taurus papillomavirus 6]CAF05685.1 E8 protein [Bos taurus papillomavirus 6]